MNSAENRPTLRLQSPFWLGNHYTKIESPPGYVEGYTYSCGTDVGLHSYRFRETNVTAVRDLLARHPRVNARLDLVDQDLGERYRFLNEGGFDIGWQVTAAVKKDEMMVNYSVRIARPDSSLNFVLSEQQPAEFYNFEYGHRKQRTRIDGLPVYLRVNGWKNATRMWRDALPSSVTLFRRGLPEQEIPFEDGAMATLQHTERLVGRWDERWLFVQHGNQTEFWNFEVELVGSWDR